MSAVTVYGSSDDLIEIDGDIYEEFNAESNDVPTLLAFSDGTVLRVHYGETGVWRITPVATGSATLQITQEPEDDDDNYTDRATLTGEISWIVAGTEIAKAKVQRESGAVRDE